MNKLKNLWPYFLILIVVFIFFSPVFKGQVPFPGDLLVNDNPYKTQSYLGYSPSGYPNKAQGPDVVKEIYPWRYFSVSEVKQGILPFWNPHNFSGNPQIANLQTGFFYPVNFLYLILPFNISWTIIIMLQSLIAGIFMYLFLSKGLKLNKFPSLIGGISFAFSSYMTVWIEYGNIGATLLWLPIALLFTKRFYERLNVLNFLSLVVILSLSILAGYIQGAFYIYAICFLYFLFLLKFGEIKAVSYKKTFVFLASLVLPFIITFFQIYPTLELFLNSTRGAYSLLQISNNLVPLQYWLTVLVPDFFGNPATRNYWIDGTYIERVMYPGIAIAFFAFYGVFNAKGIEKKFFIILSGLSLIIATNLPGIKFFYLLPIPVISTTIPTRELSVFIFCIIILGVIGLDHWQNGKDYKTKLTFGFILTYILIWVLVFLLPKFNLVSLQNISIAKHNLILPTFLAFATVSAFYFKKINKNLSLVIILLFVCLDLFYFFNKITPFSPKELIYPQTPVISYLQENAGINRFWGYGSAYVSPNYQSVDKTYFPEGNDPLHIASYGELLATSGNGRLPLVLPRPDANIAPGYGSSDLKNNVYRQRLLNLLGVKYVLNKEDTLLNDYRPDTTTFPENSYKLVWQKTPWQIYENQQALPRFFLSGDFKIEDRKTILNSIYNTNADLRKTIFLEENPNIKVDKNSTGEAKLLSYKSNEIKFLTKSEGSSILFLSDNYYSGWQAYIDGISTKIYRADYSFRAISVPAGKHEVTFSYYPANFILGLKISAIGFLLLFVSLFWIKTYEKKK